MRLPKTVSEDSTKAAKKRRVEAVSIFSDGRTALEEFGITESDNEIQAYVKVSPGDTITLSFEIPCTETQIVDVFIDGVLRESTVTSSRPANTHRGKIAEVCVCDIRPSGAKGKLQYCQMVVEDRKTTKDIRPSAPGFEDMHTSAVGTIEVRVLREIGSAVKAIRDIKPEQAERGPTFEDSLRWWDVSRRVDPGVIAPTFQIGFPSGRNTHGSSRKNINRSIEGYYIWASFKFLYRSAADIQAAGLDNNGDLSNIPSNIKANRSNNSTDKMEHTMLPASPTTDKKPILSINAGSGLSVNQIGSGASQLTQTGPVKGPHHHESTGVMEQVGEGLQVVTPAKSTLTLDDMAVVAAGGGENVSEIIENQRSLRAYCETEYSDDETVQGQALSFKSFLEITNRKKTEDEQPTDQKMSKQARLPSSRRTAVVIAEPATASFAQEAVAPDAGTAPILAENKDFQKRTVIEKSHDKRGESSGLSGKQEWDRRIKELALVFSPKTNPKTLTELPSSEQINLGKIEKVVVSGSDCDNSSHVSSLYQLSQDGVAEAAAQDLGNEGELGLAPLRKVTNVQRTASNTMMRAKAGHYMSRSPLVDPDTEDIKRQAKAMTNGKDNWQGRVSHLVQNLSAPCKKRDLIEDLSSTNTFEPTIKTLAPALLHSPAVDTPKKRNFGEFDADADSPLHPRSGAVQPLGNQNLLGMSPKGRRQEIARKKRVKQEALEKARAEADALRRQVEEFEVEQHEALVREEAELENLDMEIETIRREAQALAAYLRELHEK